MNNHMDNKNQLFSVIEPSENLKNSINNMIKREEMKKTIYKIAFSSVVFLASAPVAVIYVINIVKDFYQSGLSEYFSLIFSDGTSLMSYWQTYLMSVIESLPIIPITIVVASILISVWSVNMALTSFKNTKTFYYKVN